jgi:DNA-binding IclR family transcriptional regulator
MLQPPHNGTATSRAAANEIEPFAGRLRADVLIFLRSRGEEGATADEIEQSSGIAGNTIRPRLIELKRLGLVQQTSATRPTRSGRKAVVWRAV